MREGTATKVLTNHRRGDIVTLGHPFVGQSTPYSVKQKVGLGLGGPFGSYDADPD